MSEKWKVVKYLIFGTSLYAVERNDGWIDKYCDERADAISRVKALNNDKAD